MCNSSEYCSSYDAPWDPGSNLLYWRTVCQSIVPSFRLFSSSCFRICSLSCLQLSFMCRERHFSSDLPMMSRSWRPTERTGDNTIIDLTCAFTFTISVVQLQAFILDMLRKERSIAGSYLHLNDSNAS